MDSYLLLLPLHLSNLDFRQSAYPNPGTPSRHLLAEDTTKSRGRMSQANIERGHNKVIEKLQPAFFRSSGTAPKLDMASMKKLTSPKSSATDETSLMTPELVSQCTMHTKLKCPK